MRIGSLLIGLIIGGTFGAIASMEFVGTDKAWCIPHQVPESYANQRGLSLDTVEVLFRDNNPYSLPETYWCYIRE